MKVKMLVQFIYRKSLLKHVTVVSITIENIEISDKIHRKFKEYCQSQILEYLHKLKVKLKFQAMNIFYISHVLLYFENLVM